MALTGVKMCNIIEDSQGSGSCRDGIRPSAGIVLNTETKSNMPKLYAPRRSKELRSWCRC